MLRLRTWDVIVATRPVYRPVYEAKLIHLFDHRWSEDESGSCESKAISRGIHSICHGAVLHGRGRYREFLEGKWAPQWLLGWRDITNTTNERDSIRDCHTPNGRGQHSLSFVPNVSEYRSCGPLIANLSSFVLDYVARQKVGGTHLNPIYMKQLPVLTPRTYTEPCLWTFNPRFPFSIQQLILPRVLELTYTAWDLEPFAQDCGWRGPPFRWDEDRRFLLRCELDAAFFHLYLPADTEGHWRLARAKKVLSR